MSSLGTILYSRAGMPMEGIGSLGFRAVFRESTCFLQRLVDAPIEEQGRLCIYILFTEMGETLAALQSAGALSTDMTAEVTLLVPVTVPYPLPLEEPPVQMGFICRRITELADSVPMDIQAYVYLCRDPQRTIANALRPHSLVVIGTSRHWLFNRSKHIAKQLRSQGHDVVLVGYE
jgi:hypothetical protein